MRRLPLTCLTLLFLLACLSVATSAPVIIAGTVVGPDERPLAEAEVWLIRTVAQDYATAGTEIVQSLKTDAQGRYRFEPVEMEPAAVRAGPRYEVIALKPPLAVGRRQVPSPQSMPQWESSPLLFPRSPEHVIVQCAEAGLVSGKVVSGDGSGIAATVSYLGGFGNNAPERLKVRCAADGSFTIPWLAIGEFRFFAIEAGGYGRVEVLSLDLAEAPVVKLRPFGQLELQFTCPERPELLRVIRGTYRGEMDNFLTMGQFQADAEGRVELPELQPGTYSITVDRCPTTEWQAPSLEDVYVWPGTTRRVEVALQRAVRITGRVLVAETDEPVEGARLRVQQDDASIQGPIVTDENGAFTSYVFPGTSRIFVDELPDEYTDAKPAMVTVEVGESEVRIAPFRVQRTVMVEGVAVDERDQPVADARVYYSRTHYRHGPVLSDAQGRFMLRWSPGEGSFAWAHKGDLAAKEMPVDPAHTAEGPLKVVLAPTPQVRLRVRVANQDGQPVTNAFISPLWRSRNGRVLLAGQTDERGEWISESQIGFGSYQLQVSAPGHEAARSEPWQAIPGETHDFGEVRLGAATGSLAGTVMDQQGRPVAGVRVFNRSEALKQTEATTGPDGRFALTGILPGRAFVFADSPGHLFTGICAEVGRAEW